MLNQIVMAGTDLLCMRYQLANHIQLMITREDQLFGHVRSLLSIGKQSFLYLSLIADELLQDIQEAILL